MTMAKKDMEMDKPDFFKWYLGAAICNGCPDLVFQKCFAR